MYWLGGIGREVASIHIQKRHLIIFVDNDVSAGDLDRNSSDLELNSKKYTQEKPKTHQGHQAARIWIWGSLHVVLGLHR